MKYGEESGPPQAEASFRWGDRASDPVSTDEGAVRSVDLQFK